MQTKEKADVLKAMGCLYVCVSESVADDIIIKVKVYMEQAEAEIAEMKESHALQIDAVIKCKKELAKLKRLVERKDERSDV